MPESIHVEVSNVWYSWGGLGYNQIDQEYNSDHSGGVKHLVKPLNMISQTCFDEAIVSYFATFFFELLKPPPWDNRYLTRLQYKSAKFYWRNVISKWPGHSILKSTVHSMLKSTQLANQWVGVALGCHHHVGGRPKAARLGLLISTCRDLLIWTDGLISHSALINLCRVH